jgi:DNA-directed RNA polymerase specialized sigma24 family protein
VWRGDVLVDRADVGVGGDDAVASVPGRLVARAFRRCSGAGRLVYRASPSWTSTRSKSSLARVEVSVSTLTVAGASPPVSGDEIGATRAQFRSAAALSGVSLDEPVVSVHENGFPACPRGRGRYVGARMSAPPRAATASAGPAARDLLLADQDWATLSVKLKGYAWKATARRSWEHAEDLAQETIALAYKASTPPWDPEVEPSFFRYLTGLLRGLLSNERRLKRTTHEIATGEKTIQAFADPASAPDENVIRRQRIQQLVEALHARAEADPLRGDVAHCFARGIDGAEEQAEETRKPIEDVLRARRRLYDLAEALERRSREAELN